MMRVTRPPTLARRAARFLALGLVVVRPAAAGAPPAPGAMTLDGALARARADSPALGASAAELEAARGRLVQARLLPANPVISGEGARHTAPGEEQIDRGVALAQEIEVGGQRGLRIEGARHDVARAEQLLADRRRLVDGEVRRSFFTLAASERRRALAREAVGVADAVAEAAGRRARAGDVGALDVRLAEIEAARAAQALAAADAEHAAAVARLAAALGADPGEALAVRADDTDPPPAPAEADVVAHALAVRPDLAAAREERARLESEAALARRRGVVPNPVVRGFYREELLLERIAGGEISVPLPVWNREQGTEMALRAGASAAGSEVRRLTTEIPRQVQVALVRRTTALAAWRRYRHDTLPAIGAARDLLERGQAAGYVGLPERLVQQDRLLQVQAAAIDTWREVHVADADLIEAAGGSLP